MQAITNAFVQALVENAGTIVLAAVGVLLAALEAARRWLVARTADDAVDMHSGDREAAEEHVARAPRLKRPMTKRGTQKVVKRALLRQSIKKQQKEEEQVAAMGGLPVDSPQLPVPPAPPVDDDSTPPNGNAAS